MRMPASLAKKCGKVIGNISCLAENSLCEQVIPAGVSDSIAATLRHRRGLCFINDTAQVRAVLTTRCTRHALARVVGEGEPRVEA
jgi:hypothetical protein